MRLTSFFLILALTGCATAPSIQYCDNIQYTRTGNQIRVEADCQIPMDDGGMDFKDMMGGIVAGLLMGM